MSSRRSWANASNMVETGSAGPPRGVPLISRSSHKSDGKRERVAVTDLGVPPRCKVGEKRCGAEHVRVVSIGEPQRFLGRLGRDNPAGDQAVVAEVVDDP